ncbi:MAG: metallophosphoesterase [Paracoccaceae bacterium]
MAVVGDIHGRADLLDRMLTSISRQAPEARLIFVGDYVDRGPDSRTVINRLREQKDAICLCGNHEAMMLDILTDPIETGGRWLRNGGVETLASYGISLSQESSSKDVRAASSALGRALSDGSETWLKKLPLMWESGNLLVTHAGPDPARSITGQEARNFLWGHSRFLRDSRSDGLWVAHGHWIRDKAISANGRISVDTGAWTSGRLTAALVGVDGRVNFVTVR